jgi:flagellar basal body-associated protein FliL
MTTQRKVLKLFIIIILAVFLLATGLTSVMYLASPKNSADSAS